MLYGAIDSLVYTVKYVRILGWPVIYMYQNLYAYTKEQKYRVWN